MKLPMLLTKAERDNVMGKRLVYKQKRSQIKEILLNERSDKKDIGVYCKN